MTKVTYQKDGRVGRITRHSPEGMIFKHRAEDIGWKEAVRERDLGTFDWTENKKINRAD